MSSVHIITQGCSANTADSEIMAGILQKNNHHIVNSIEQADIIVFNTCTVKTPSENSFKRQMKALEKQNKKIIITGCIPQSQKNLGRYNKCSTVGTDQLEHIGKAVQQTVQGRQVRLLKKTKADRIQLPKKRFNKHVEIIPIAQGCMSTCTFCKTKHARGTIQSERPREIRNRVAQAVKEGVKEIWLTSQDNSVYGRDLKTSLPVLLQQLTEIEGDFKMRVGMANPHFLQNELDKLLTVMKHENLFKFLHIPVQSGSDDVLKNMKRDHSVAEYITLVQKAREVIPDITIATDIICGFPTETKEDFQKTIQLIKQTKPDIINISRFWPRPGTKAAKLKQLPTKTVKERSTIMTKLFHNIALENNKKWIGWQGNVTFTEKGKHNTSRGRNHAYKQVIVKGSHVGKTLPVTITDCTSFDLRGNINKCIR